MSNDEELKWTLSAGEVLVDDTDATRYEAHELIGRGGMGEVYRATRLTDGAPCAVKCVRSDLISNPTVLIRSTFEAHACRKIVHPNVVRVVGTGIGRNNVPWMAMEWLEGFTLGQIIEKEGRVPLRWAIEMVRDLCRGLRAIHEYAIHRDIKPSNVHLGLDGVTRALDLGAAKSTERDVHLTSTGVQLGTLPYMAPEQLANSTIDHRVDLWAATVVLYTLIAGVHPFAVNGKLPNDKFTLGYRILVEPHRPLNLELPSAPSFLTEIIDRGLAKARDERHRSAEELARVLTAALDYLEASTGHAEPLSSFVRQLSGMQAPVIAEPPRLLWRPRLAPLVVGAALPLAPAEDQAPRPRTPRGTEMMIQKPNVTTLPFGGRRIEEPETLPRVAVAARTPRPEEAEIVRPASRRENVTPTPRPALEPDPVTTPGRPEHLAPPALRPEKVTPTPPPAPEADPVTTRGPREQIAPPASRPENVTPSRLAPEAESVAPRDAPGPPEPVAAERHTRRRARDVNKQPGVFRRADVEAYKRGERAAEARRAATRWVMLIAPVLVVLSGLALYRFHPWSLAPQAPPEPAPVVELAAPPQPASISPTNTPMQGTTASAPSPTMSATTTPPSVTVGSAAPQRPVGRVVSVPRVERPASTRAANPPPPPPSPQIPVPVF